MFTLHPQLAQDCAVVGDYPICRVLLNKQFSQFPWLILVPKRTGLRDLTDMAEQDYLPVMEEVRAAHDTLRDLSGADKMNMAAIGNMVPQLHIHLIARFKDDACWPKPVWGNADPSPYDADALVKMVETVRETLDLSPVSE